MRVTLAAASLATAVAVLAGCSGSSQGTLPTSASQGAMQNAGGEPSGFQLFPKVITREQASKLHASVLPEKVLEAALRRPHPTHIKLAKSERPSRVITDIDGYIWWLSRDGKVTGYATDCSGAEGAIVDHQGRLIVACGFSSTINIYNKGNTTGPADVVLNDASGFNPGDVFEDENGIVYASNVAGYACGSQNCTNYPGDIVWWTTGNQSTGSSPSGSYTDPNLFEDSFADVDANGNVYVDGLHCTYQGLYGCYAGVAEVDTITNVMGSAPSASNDNVSINWPGGIYTMGNGKISVIDQGCNGCGNGAVYLYSSLPGTPATTLNTPQNPRNGCNPVSGGYNADDGHVLIGDAGCRAGDLGKVSSNTWKNITSIDFQGPIGGAFLKSDK